MPSSLHEVLIDMFRQRPMLAAQLLTDGLGLRLPAYEQVRMESADLTSVARPNTAPMPS